MKKGIIEELYNQQLVKALASNSEPVKLPLTKLVMDKLLAGLLLILTSPLTLLISLAIKLEGLLKPENRGPIFYQEERISQGESFGLIKFRILKTKAIEEQIKKGAIPKLVENQFENLTGVGRFLKKFSLDEIPQFLNILKGDMSFVGPRPKPPAEYQEEIARGIYRRKVIRAGLTGAAQLMKGTIRTPEDELESDLKYIHKCRTLSSWQILLMDLSILLRTIRLLLKGTGE
jgi:lipopolysaccharide/colanic/teichoic acid biosynthesis glycosyltransferase